MSATILLVEDNPITRKMVTFALTHQGFEVVEAPDGGTALELLQSRVVDLVLQDLVLPDVDGFELVERMRALPAGREVPILAVSGLVSKLDEARMSSVGFDDVIAKPVEPSRLVEIVRAHLPGLHDGGEGFGEGRRLLLVDDDPVQLKLARFRLERAGFDVLTATDGVEALEQSRSHHPDVVVSDVLMPRLDGFGLCIELRSDPALAGLPVVLATNSYLEPSDARLAERAGAAALVIRTPDLRGILQSVRAALERREAPAPSRSPSPSDPKLDLERMRRVARQLDKQVDLNAGVMRRSALLAAEIAVLNGIAEALATHESTDAALEHALAACLDAGGISRGALFVNEGSTTRVLAFGSRTGWDPEPARSFLDAMGSLGHTMRQQRMFVIPDDLPGPASQQLLEACQATSALLLPLTYRDQVLGALLLASDSGALHADDQQQFSQTVAAQISQAIALTRSFEATQTSTRLAVERAEILNSILTSIADGVVVVDANGRFTHFNPAAEALLGGGALDIEPSDWPGAYGLYHADRETPFAPDQLPLVRALRGELVDDVEMYVRRSAGHPPRWLNINARPLRAGDTEAIRGAVAAFHDITASREARASEMVADRLATMGMLAAGVAHEINNPLAALAANLQLVEQELDRTGGPPHMVEMVAEAREAALHVRRIALDLNVFARTQERAGAQVTAAVEEVLESSIRMAWAELRHRARLERDYEPVPRVHGSGARLAQVFLNLLINAAHAIREGAAEDNTIRLTIARTDPGWVTVSITDTGHGIEDSVMDRLFTPFFTTKPEGEGTGLGLSICRRIVSEAGGRIEVDSRVGQGTTFQVVLRAAESAPPAAAERTVPETAPGDATPTRGQVLVVDDEPLITRILHRVLSPVHDVTICHDGRRALDLVADGQRFDVILCDLMMPLVTGVQLHRALQEQAPEQAERVLFLTGGAFTNEAREYLQSVPVPLLTKPFDLDEIRAVVGAFAAARGPVGVEG